MVRTSLGWRVSGWLALEVRRFLVGGLWSKRSSIVIIRQSYPREFFPTCGQVAQLVERSPEKAGVGGSIPSLATTF